MVEKKLKGIGGWLILPLVYLIIVIFYLSIIIITSLSSIGSEAGRLANTFFGLYLVVDIFAIYVLILFFKKPPY